MKKADISFPMMPPKSVLFGEINPNKIELHIMINVPQNQCLPNRAFLIFSSTYMPEMKINPENRKEERPKPRLTKTSLVHAPTLFNQFSALMSLDVNSEMIL